MARRKRKEEEVVWTPPEFDEVGYMRREIENAKIAVVVVAWAAVGAVIAYALWEFVHPVVGFLIGLTAFGVLYFLLPMLGLPIHGFKRRDWISHGSIYFFSWLAFWIVILNPPFGDHTAPTVSFTEVGGYVAPSAVSVPGAGTVYCIPVANGETIHVPPGSPGNNTLYVLFRATDNVGVAQIRVQVNGVNATYDSVGGQPSVCKGANNAPFAPNTYAVRVPITISPFTVSVAAYDAGGRGAFGSITFLVP